MAKDLKFCIKEVEGMYYLCSENKGADQLRGYREADPHLCCRIICRFSHNAVGIMIPLNDSNGIANSSELKDPD